MKTYLFLAFLFFLIQNSVSAQVAPSTKVGEEKKNSSLTVMPVTPILNGTQPTLIQSVQALVPDSVATFINAQTKFNPEKMESKPE